MLNVNHTNLGNVSLTSWDNAKGETKWLLVGKHGAAFFPTNEALIDAILNEIL